MRLPHVSSNTAVVTGPISVGGCVKRTPRAASRRYSPATSSTPKDVNGIPSCTSAALTARRQDGRSARAPVRCRPDPRAKRREPGVFSHRDLCLLREPEDVGVEAQCLGLIIDEDACQVDSHGFGFRRGTGQRSVMLRSGVVSSEWNLKRLSRRLFTKPVASRTSRCCEMAWRVEPRPCLVARRAHSSNNV